MVAGEAHSHVFPARIKAAETIINFFPLLRDNRRWKMWGKGEEDIDCALVEGGGALRTYVKGAGGVKR